MYDPVGNRSSSVINGVSTSYSYDDNDRLTSAGGDSYSYDDNGNTLSRTEGGVTTSFVYDKRNRMVSSTSGGVTTSYGYNADGIRTERSSGGSTTEFVVDHNRDYAQVVAEITDGDFVVGYSFGDDLISQVFPGGSVFFYHYDGLGSTRSLSDNTGTFTDEYDYEAFGELTGISGSTANSYLFAGEQFDSGLGDYYLRARYYSQGIGRFTQMDSFQGLVNQPVTLHKYIYGNVDPVGNIDPSGFVSLSELNIGINNTLRIGSRQVGVSSLRTFVNKALTTTIQQSGRAVGQSLKALRTCIRQRNKCGLSANLLIVGQDNPAIADHIRDAQSLNPRNIVLTYVVTKIGNRRWYATGGGRGGCRIPGPPGYQCDEYPFFKTREGGPGPGNQVKLFGSTRWVPARENLAVGGHFGFLARNMKNRSKFIVVADPAIPVTVALPLGRN